MPHVVSTDREFHRIARVRLRHRRITIGRALGNTLTLPDPRISRRHCEIRLADGPARIVDRGSTHGLLVNGLRVRKVDLNDGDIIELGSFRLTYIAALGPAVSADNSDGECPCLEIECRPPSERRGEDDSLEEYDRVLGEALRQIEILKRRLLDVTGQSRDPAAWSEGADGGHDRSKAGEGRKATAAMLDPPLPLEMLFEMENGSSRSMADVDLGKWFVALLLMFLAVALLWLFI